MVPALTPLGADEWMLLEDFRYFGFTIPSGFVCDLDSVPRVPFVYARYKGRTRLGALLHDYLYATQPCSRQHADLLFLWAMREEKVPWNFRNVMWLAVRLVGWWPWYRNQRK